MDWLLLVGVAFLLLPNYMIGRRYLAAHVAAHGTLPSWGWLTTRDADPDVERWRRWRLVTSTALIVTLLVYVAFVLFG